MTDTIDTSNAQPFIAQATPGDVGPEEALSELQKRYDDLMPLRARSQAALGLFLGTIHELEPVFHTEEGRRALETKVKEMPAVRKSRTYSTTGKSIIHLLLIAHMDLDSDPSQRLGYEQAIQAGHAQPRAAETFAKWLKAVGGVSGAREQFRKLKKAGAFGGNESKAEEAEEPAIEKLAKTYVVSDARKLLLPETLPPEAHVGEGYFMVVGHATKEEDGTIKAATVGLWQDPTLLDNAAKLIENQAKAAERRRKQQIADINKVTAYWKRKAKEGFRTGGANLVEFIEAAEREAEELKQEEIKAIELTVEIDPAADQEDEWVGKPAAFDPSPDVGNEVEKEQPDLAAEQVDDTSNA